MKTTIAYTRHSSESTSMQPNKTATSRILSASNVRVGSDRAPVGQAVEEACGGPPKVETRQRNGAISEIVITCGCGQQTVIECDYTEVRTVKI